jgi:hypothetical protein
MKISRPKAISALVLGAFLLSFLFTNAAYAQNDSNNGSNVQYLVGTGVLCTVSASLCPDKATASNGDTVYVAGLGEFNPDPSEQATGGGSFVHVSSTGAIVGFGTWTAEELISWGPGGFSTLGGVLPAGSEGGVAVLMVHLNPATGGAGFDAVLTISCALVTAGVTEGITLSVSGGPTFGTSTGGGTLFINPSETDEAV